MGLDPLLSVIVLNWNTPELTHTAVESIRSSVAGAAASRADVNGTGASSSGSSSGGSGIVDLVEIILVDNGSERPPSEATCALADHYLQLPRNLGFSGGMNAGLSIARGQWVAFCNSDVEWLPETYPAFLAAADCAQSQPRSPEPSRVGLLGGYLLKSAQAANQTAVIDAHIDTDAYRLPWTLTTGRLPGEYRDTPCLVTGLSGALFFAAQSALTDLKVNGALFDPAYGSYGEDKDLWLRASIQGWQILYWPQLRAVHLGSQSTSGEQGYVDKAAWVQVMATRNRIRTLVKNLSALELAVYLPAFMAGIGVFAVGNALRGRPQAATSALKAAAYHWWHGWNIAAARRAYRSPSARTFSATGVFRTRIRPARPAVDRAPMTTAA